MMSSAGKKKLDSPNVDVSLDLHMVTISTRSGNEDEAHS